jgi:hypothetical protein
MFSFTIICIFRKSGFPVRSVFVINVLLFTSVVCYCQNGLRRIHGKCSYQPETPILPQGPKANMGRGLIWHPRFLVGFSYLCNVLRIIVCSFVVFLLVIVFSALLRLRLLITSLISSNFALLWHFCLCHGHWLSAMLF